MRLNADSIVESGLDRYIAAFEEAKYNDGRADPSSFLPDRSDPLYLEVLREIVRVDLEFSWAGGNGPRLDDYRHRFPELFDDFQSVQALCFEDFRLRRQAGEDVTAEEYQRRFGADTNSWPVLRPPSFADHGFRMGTSHVPRLAMPEVGDTLFGFELLGELGRGTFATVFLARQASLADRLVALKVSRARIEESGILARLQHTNIVPVYSVHHTDSFQIICMPFYGSTTLADLLREMRDSTGSPGWGEKLVETIVARQSVSKGSGLDTTAVPPTAASCLKSLSSLKHVEAALWIASRLAQGLHHAHERGILHRDLKPANVLVADDGQPMLLDFNLSEDLYGTAGIAGECMGGTLPYMSPESLLAYKQGTRAGDVRSDVYSLGVIVYELLACRQPFPSYAARDHDALSIMLADRQHLPLDLRRFNKSVSPAVEAIVQKCLASDPDRRYASAADLHEDLERQLKHQPLRFAPEPSLRERAGKWVRRHPSLSSASSIAVVAAVVVALLACGLVLRAARLAHLEAADNLAQFQNDMRKAQMQLLDGPTAGQSMLDAASDNCRHALDHFGAIENPGWQESPQFQELLPDQKVRAREDVGELLFLMAAIEGLKNDAVGQSSSQGEHLAQAFDLNRRSEECYPANEAPGALWQQRAVFAERASKYDESRECLLKATARPPKTTRDYGMAACMLTSQWRFGAALPLWQQASSSDPQNVWAWYGLGHCYDQLSQPARAAACYTACIALKPDYYGWYFKRGLNYLKQKDYSLALADLDETLKLRPGAAEARFNRAVVLLNLNRCPEAIANLEDLVGQGHDDARTRLLLAQAKEKAGDPEGARRERIAGLQRKPIDDNAWVAQAIARSKVDPVGAVKDLDRALDYNAFSAAALESKANLFAERLGRTEDAVAVLDRAVAIYPENASLLAARGVLLARLGRNAPARHDAQAALSLAALSMDQLAATSYQVAGIYALLSRTESADLDRAIELLAAALRSGYGEDLIAADKDLDPLRKQAKFQQLLQALHTLHPTSADSRANNTRQTAND